MCVAEIQQVQMFRPVLFDTSVLNSSHLKNCGFKKDKKDKKDRHFD